MGVSQFYGPGLVVDTTKPFTVVTQFLTTDGTSASDLVEIRRSFVQNGVVHGNPVSTFAPIPYDSVTDSYCAAQKSLFGDPNIFGQKGGLKAMGDAMDRGMTLVMSLWDDYDVSMLWLDSTFPVNGTANGTKRGTCATTSGLPTDVESNSPHAYVVYSDVRWGEIGSTFNGNPVTASSAASQKTTTAAASSTAPTVVTSVKTSSAAVTTSAQSGCAAVYGQCGGKGWMGPTCCTDSTCTVNGEYYSQCLPGAVVSPTTTAAITTTAAASSKTAIPVSSVTSAQNGCAPKWGQCGGNSWTGPTCCDASTCTVNNEWYSQCL
ncbi:concanavalin A-like lectin/glucanase domain-containing protein [Chytriomyces sp. MP71]|nr:concanavalin A-like lectin/glucanase domain-containing protein [Chytriomyces sp. MP71]